MPAILTIKVIALTAAIAVPATHDKITHAGVYTYPQRDFYQCMVSMNTVDAFNAARGNVSDTKCE